VRVAVLTTLAMIAFAGNSLLCRAALNQTTIDPASFTSVRLACGAATLWFIVRLRRRHQQSAGKWLSAFVLFLYAAGFSLAYVKLSAATGALLLFGAVQATMIGYGLWKGERLHKRQRLGLMCATAGLVGLLLPGLSAPPLSAAVLMLMAGTAWGVYSLRGQDRGDSISMTAGNFLRSVPFAVGLSLLMLNSSSLDPVGFWYAAASGALTSGIGYVLWYSALSAIDSTTAATVQLSVPVVTALGGVALLGEPITFRLAVTSVAILGGIAMVIFNRQINRA
jgi:drug/metabolite transporter (DMT)-like permease